MKDIKNLVCTADKRFWPSSDESLILLGEWCLVWPESENKANFEILEYQLDDRDLLFKTYLDLKSRRNRLFSIFGEALNCLHGQSRPTESWDIIAGYWFANYLEVFYDRYLAIKTAMTCYPDCKVKVLDERCYYTPVETMDFMDLQNTDIFNQQIYSQIIELHNSKGWSVRKLAISGAARKQLNSTDIAKRVLKKIFVWCSKFNRTYITAMYFPIRSLVKLSFKLNIFPNASVPSFADVDTPVNLHSRNIFKTYNFNNEFEQMFFNSLSINTPRSFIENFDLVEKASNRYFPSKAKIAITSVGFAASEAFKVWVANRKEDGPFKYVIHQHGGTYGSARWYSSEDYERRVSDVYLTYGWLDDNSQQREETLLGITADRFVECSPNISIGKKSGGILWVLCSFPRYPYIFYATSSGPHFKGYMRDQVSFLNSLEPSTRKLIECRPYPKDYGWGDLLFYQKYCGVIKKDTSKSSLMKSLRSARLVVTTYNSTAFLEALGSNVPTVAYWDKNVWELRPSAEPYYDNLVSACILFYSSEAAAAHVNKISDDPIGWWSSANVQNARKRFCNQFLEISDDPLGQWQKFIELEG